MNDNSDDSLSLPHVVPPFLPPLTHRRYTLVLDLDETLIHYIESSNDPNTRYNHGPSEVG